MAIRIFKIRSYLEIFFLQDCDLSTAWSSFPVDFTHSQEINGTPHFAILDHFCCSETTLGKIENAGVIHSIENFSDHSPIYCVLQSFFSVESLDLTSHSHISEKAKPKWKLANSDERAMFKTSLDAQLRNLVVPESLHCRDLHCKDDQHLADSDDFIKAVLNSVDFAANSCIPLAKSKRERSLCKAGWSDYVKPLLSSGTKCGYQLEDQLIVNYI